MKTMKFTLLTALLAIAFGFNSCIEDFSIIGNGHSSTETRWTPDFEEVKSSGSYEVYIVPGDDYLVEVTAESNLLPYIVTDVDGNQLKIRTRGVHNLHNTEPMKVYITMPNLRGVTLSGSGYIESEHFSENNFNITLSGSGHIDTSIDVDELNANISGSGKINIAGFCNHSDMQISGSGKIRSYDLEQNTCHAKISGSGNMYVNVSNLLEANISGSGSIFFINTPDVHSSISGSGKVINDN